MPYYFPDDAGATNVANNGAPNYGPSLGNAGRGNLRTGAAFGGDASSEGFDVYSSKKGRLV